MAAIRPTSSLMLRLVRKYMSNTVAALKMQFTNRGISILYPVIFESNDR